MATKEDLKEGLKEVKAEVHDLKTGVKYLKNDVNNLKADSPTAKEFQNHEVRIRKLETLHASV